MKIDLQIQLLDIGYYSDDSIWFKILGFAGCEKYLIGFDYVDGWCAIHFMFIQLHYEPTDRGIYLNNMRIM